MTGILPVILLRTMIKDILFFFHGFVFFMVFFHAVFAETALTIIKFLLLQELLCFLCIFFGMKTFYLILKMLGGLSDGCKVENAIPNITSTKYCMPEREVSPLWPHKRLSVGLASQGSCNGDPYVACLLFQLTLRGAS